MTWKPLSLGVILVLFAAAVPAHASPIGLLRLDSGAGGVNVSLTTIDWTPPVGPPNGAFLVAAGTTLTSAAGNPAVGSTGLILDITTGTILPLLSFMTFPALPGLSFDLTQLGPGSANTNCAGLSMVGQSCSPFLGSPFILTLTTTGTGITLSAAGVARDGTLPNSTWMGNYTSQLSVLPGLPPGTVVRPVDVQNFFGCTAASIGPFGCTNQQAVISSSYSGEFIASVTPIPEPATVLLVGAPALVGMLRRRSARRQNRA
jgi:hypothetical protein